MWSHAAVGGAGGKSRIGGRTLSPKLDQCSPTPRATGANKDITACWASDRPSTGVFLPKAYWCPTPSADCPLSLPAPAGDRLVVGDDQVVGFNVESLHITNQLPVAIGHDGLYVAKPAGLCGKGEPGAVLKISEGLQIERALSRPT